ncbi:hypothetical protein [Sphaerochaeta pleomorpha]|uniref:hypothetical protein n=1 Tax=Sphaerochaeta pleomorpha TaxID=1131707 RepID=UPI0002DB5F41|nr:hypothetical protein [Sphaerochaeta pleomorpha]
MGEKRGNRRHLYPYCLKSESWGTIVGDAASSIANASSFVIQNFNGGKVHITLDNMSSWTLTGDSTISSYQGDMTRIQRNGYTPTIM